MKPGQASRTAVWVCMGRAAANARPPVDKFSDPTALELLPDEARARTERALARVKDRSLRGRMVRGFLDRQASFMAVRTVAIDEAVRGATARQVVILGAGLDGRAWRMGELSDAVVFEVDHPDSQREKKARVGRLRQAAREVRFVAVDFTRDRLGDALAKAGHDPSLPTTWVWEGVVMYLAPEEVEATLAILSERSAPGSRLIVLYHTPTLLRHGLGLFVRRIGEPFRSWYSPAEMRALLARHRYTVVHDDNLPELARSMSARAARSIRFSTHMRVVVAERP